MFTGIVEETGLVDSLSHVGGGYQLRVRAKQALDGLKIGDSVAVNGACLTVTRFDPSSFTVGLSPETLRRTNLGGLKAGDRVNLERALRPVDRLGGHFVQGHVDGVATVIGRRSEGDAVVMRFETPKGLSKYIVEKGFVALDGVSLTVVARSEGWFEVSLIPFTRQIVTLAEKKVGDGANLEVDIISKYVESILASRETRKGITAEFLAEQGFI